VKLFLSVCLAIIVSVCAAPVFAWGQTGHKLICAVAEKNFTPKAHAFVKEVLEYGEFLDNDSQMTFVEACLWADESRFTTHTGSYEQHFINIPAGANRVSLARDCAALDCIVVGIQRNLVYLKNPASGKREQARKAAALRFLGHFVGDLHQPLHVSHAEDWGGNKIKVSFRKKQTNLHGLWDTVLLEAAGLAYPDSVEWLASQQTDIGSRNVLEWMNESFRFAEKKAYLDTDGEPISMAAVISEDYFLRSKPIIQQRLLLSAHRLAYLINTLATGKLDTNILID
jgi:hypothetical protein